MKNEVNSKIKCFAPCPPQVVSAGQCVCNNRAVSGVIAVGSKEDLSDMKFNTCIESDGGAWEYFKDAESGQIFLLYFKPDSSEADISIPITAEEFKDLKTLFKNVKKS